MTIVQTVPDSRLMLLSKMEEAYEKKDVGFFVCLLEHDDYVIRTRAVCILVDFGGEDKIQHIAKVLKNDPNELVRHEAAFSLGQMGYQNGIKSLEEATKNDSSFFVRHEAAIALGVIGSQEAKETLQKALNDSSKPVRESAEVAPSNLRFMKRFSKNEKFAKLTGG